MKKTISVLLVFLMVFVFVSCKTEETKPDTSEPSETTTQAVEEEENENVIRIGVFEVQTGDYAMGAKQSLIGVRYANEIISEFELSETKYKVKLDEANFINTVESAREAAKKLVSDGVCAVIGSFDSDILESVCDIFYDAHIPVICPNGCSISTLENYDNVFSFCADDFEQAQKCAGYAFNQIMARKALIVSKLGDNSGQSQALYFKEAFEGLGGSAKIITFEDEIELDASASDYGMIFAPVPQYYATKLIDECISGGINVSILGNSNWDSGLTLSKSTARPFPIYTYCHFAVNQTSSFYNDFSYWISQNSDIKFLNGDNTIVSSASVQSYDAYMLVMNLIMQKSSFDVTDIFGAIYKFKYIGESGDVSFDKSGKNKIITPALKRADNYDNFWNIVDKEK